MSPRIDPDYIEVSERIRMFKEKYPEGSLQTYETPRVWTIGDRSYIGYCAAAYRTPDDPRPGIGWAWELVPGPTAFTNLSELMNAETSAWGRAIVALGFETKKIASANEVRNRGPAEMVMGYADDPSDPSGHIPRPVPKDPEGFQAPATEKPVTQGVLDELAMILRLLDSSYPEHPGEGRTWANVAREHTRDLWQVNTSTDLTLAQGHELRGWLEDQYTAAAKEASIPFG